MDTRREFLRKAAMLAGATGLSGVLPPSIQRALAIDPVAGTTWEDAEHIVILMQENRSFDHCFGALRGVRGYRDPRAITLPDGNPVWLQTNPKGETYTPFRLDIKDTKATWMGSLPHSWSNQTDARNEGKYDKWLQAKPSGHKDYAEMPLTLGYYDRRDIPFYYAMADAFTICDQNFCSSLTGTTPNRLYLWTGTIRDEQRGNVRARVRNEDTDYGVEAGWTTFPERLEDLGVDWRIYQNEINLFQAWQGEEEAWLCNFSDNPIEWFAQYHVRFSKAYVDSLPVLIDRFTKKIDTVRQQLNGPGLTDRDRGHLEYELSELQKILQVMQDDKENKTAENFAKLTERERRIHQKAFTTNTGDPAYHELTSIRYQDGGEMRDVKVPKGDIFHQFREDVNAGKLPAISWLVAPENFSDHPSAPWYGAWYVSETLDILTKNPEVWKKTIFILCYDENDGYFDHVPPFVAPDPVRPETGKVSAGIDASLDYMSRALDMQRATPEDARGGPIGLGFRVPLVIASPWSRGGYVNSQVFDHTSILQFLEKWVTKKAGKPLRETNISEWRRTVCGDLTSVFRPYNGEKEELPLPLQRQEVVEGIHKAKFKQLPAGYHRLTTEEIQAIRRDPSKSPLMEVQERGSRPSCALPYELYVDGGLSKDKKAFEIRMKAGKDLFGDHSAGSPFTVYVYGKEFAVRNYAVKAGDELTDRFALKDFANGQYDLRVYGPNGFYRAFKGDAGDELSVRVEYDRRDGKPTGRLIVRCDGHPKPGAPFLMQMEVTDNYKKLRGDKPLQEAMKEKFDVPLEGPKGLEIASSFDMSDLGGWYDLTIRRNQTSAFSVRCAGRIETGKDGHSDPAMG